jgi:hypothetical protein
MARRKVVEAAEKVKASIEVLRMKAGTWISEEDLRLSTGISDTSLLTKVCCVNWLGKGEKCFALPKVPLDIQHLMYHIYGFNIYIDIEIRYILTMVQQHNNSCVENHWNAPDKELPLDHYVGSVVTRPTYKNKYLNC